MTKKYILVGTVLVLLGTTGCSYIPTENISYGVYYNDTDLSNTPKNELQARLQEVNDKIPQTISIDMGNNKKQQATYHDLGIQFDTEAMVKAISTYGYEDDMWTVLSHRFNGLFGNRRLNTVKPSIKSCQCSFNTASGFILWSSF